MNSPNSNSQTTHADRVAGWIVWCVAAAAIVGMFIVACCPRLSAISQSQILGICGTAVGILGGAFNSRRAATVPDSSQQVTIPIGAGDGSAGVTVTTTTGTAATPPASDPGSGAG